MQKQNLETLSAVDEALREILGQDYFEGDADIFLSALVERGFVVVKDGENV